MSLTLNLDGVRFPLELPSVTIPKASSGETKVVRLSPGGVNKNVKKHLRSNRLYYSQVVFRSLDSAQVALLLAGYRVKVGKSLVPIAQVVDPRPVRYVGNYLAFKMSVTDRDDEWADWLKARGIVVGSTSVDVVPLASGGTFAEAVLGRANSAEKLDITRFWNWQDSPIPLQPTEIAAIQSGSRAMDEDITPGQLSSPIVNITNPTTLPDPAGTAAILSAIQNGSMFRDMSGLQATIGLAQAALQAGAAGASSAGQQAGTNMQTHLQAQAERMRILADLAKAAISTFVGAPNAQDGRGKQSNHSQDGAKVNYFDKTSGQGGGTNVADGNTGTGGGTTSYSQNPGILAATWGDSQSPSNLIDRLTGTVTSHAAVPAGSTPELVSDGSRVTIEKVKFWLKAFIPARVPGVT
ncbi:hypothetical protein, partial [Nocardia sp. NPDC058497]|uniref:hypothetical protein n=1 Tax=Nocardia sp. NPDC058497 TaxID=3346529 RepID=UPI003665FE76